MEENRLIGFGIEIKRSHHSMEQRYQCLCTTSSTHKYFVQRKRKALFDFKGFLSDLFGFDLVNDTIEQCWKTDPISACQAPFSFYFLLIQIQFLRLVGTNISNSVYTFHFQFYVML